MQFRTARLSDNDALCALSAGSPMAGEITVAVDRSPDYFAFYNLFGENGCDWPPEVHYSRHHHIWSSVVAVDNESSDKLVGVLMAAQQTLLVDGKPTVVSRPEDGRVHADYRRRGLARKMGFKLFELYPRAAYDFATVYIIRGNVKAENAVLETEEPTMLGMPVANIHMTHLSLYKPYREDKSLLVETATPADRAEIIELLAEHYSRYNFAPVMDGEEWDYTLRASLGYGYEHIHVLRDSGRIIAVAGLWDDFAVRRYIVMKWSGKMKFAMLLAKAIRIFLPAPAPPRPGRPMRSYFLKHFACRPGFEDRLQGLLKILANRVRRAKTHNSIWGSFAENDPMRTLLDPFLKTESVSRMYVIPGNTGYEIDVDRMRSRPIFADFSMV